MRSIENFDQENSRKKICTSCKREKMLELFPIDKTRRDGHREQCKPCRALVKRQWKKTNIESVRQSGKRWRENNPDHHRQYCLANPEIIKKIRRRRYEKERNNPMAVLHRRISKRMGESLRGTKNGRSWELLVGYTVDKLKKNLERKFLPGMSWDNIGEWHIDHKIPVSAFNFESPEDIDFKKCWSLKNLQPLWKVQNLKKGASLDKPHQPSLAIGL